MTGTEAQLPPDFTEFFLQIVPGTTEDYSPLQEFLVVGAGTSLNEFIFAESF